MGGRSSGGGECRFLGASGRFIVILTCACIGGSWTFSRRVSGGGAGGGVDEGGRGPELAARGGGGGGQAGEGGLDRSIGGGEWGGGETKAERVDGPRGEIGREGGRLSE